MKFKIGDEVKIIPGATFANNGARVPDSCINVKLYVRLIKDGMYMLGKAPQGAFLGLVAESNLKLVAENEAMIKPYIVQVIEDNFPVYHSPSKTSGIIRRADNTSLFFIVDERAGFGKLQMGAGWVELAKVKKFK